MRQLLAASMSAVATMLASDAAACVPFRFDMPNISADSVAGEMTREAASVEIMRVVSRSRIPAHPYYQHFSGPMYEYRLEAVEALKGLSHRALSFTAPDANWIQKVIPGARRFEHTPLWWLTPEGYDGLQRLSIYLPDNFDSTTCSGAVLFEMGEQYLVFTGQNGELLSPGLAVGNLGQQRPVLERLHGPSDPWLIAVRAAIEGLRH